ncbi:MAG: hypothetical protein ABH919_02895 [bacterium]
MFDLLAKSIILWQKPKVIVIAGKETADTAGAVYKVLSHRFKAVRLSEENLKTKDIYKKEILILETDLENSSTIQDLQFIFKKSKLPILVLTDSIEPTEINKFKELAQILPDFGHLILSFDNEEVQKINTTKCLTFGFQKGADYQATNIIINSRINFKLNHKGNTVPIWLENANQEKHISAALAAIATATIFNLNLVEISTALKS